MQVDADLIKKYHEGNCSEAEKNAVEQWLSNHSPEDVPAFPRQVNAFNAEVRIWGKLEHFKAQRKRRSKLLYISAAAACIAFIAVAIFLNNGKINTPDHDVAGVAYKTIKTPHGKRSEFTLPDGTIVYLNAGSEISFPMAFTGNRREIHLKGEAFLKVFKDSTHPFIVKTLRTQVQVLGTAFNLRDYPDSDRPAVVVQEGKVRFGSADSLVQIILTADQMGQLSPGNKIELSKTHAARYMLWTNGKLVFDDEPIHSIVNTLERWYDVTIEVPDLKIQQQRFTGQFANQPVEEVLNKIAFVLNRKTEKKESHFLIK